MSSPVDHEYGMQTLEMESARPGSTTRPALETREQWEIDVPDDVETETQTEAGSLPPPRESPRRRHKGRGGKSSKRAQSGKGKGLKLGRPKYQKVESERVDTVDTAAVAMADRNAYDFGGADGVAVMERLKIVDVPSSKPSVSPPSSVSMFAKKISVQDVQPAFYIPGMHMLASPPLPPQPNMDRLRTVPKPEEEERDGDCVEDQGPAFMASPTVTALSEVTATTQVMSEHAPHMRSVTHLSRGWNVEDEERMLVAEQE
jgi:hypothetical protein